MKRSHWIIYGLLIFAAFGLALSFILEGLEWLSPVIVLLGITMLVAVQREWWIVSTVAGVVFIAGISFAAWKGFVPGLLLLVFAANLSAWDLISMLARFKQVKMEAVDPQIEGKHLIRLAVVNAIGLLLGSAGLLFRINLSVGIEILLSLLAAFALSRLILHLRRADG